MTTLPSPPPPRIAADELSPPPGVVISHVRAESGQYVGSPSLAILPDGALVATHDLFGPATREFESGVTLVFRSEDGGASWTACARLKPAFWSGLFVHDGVLYLLGTTHHHGQIAIRRSRDGGRTWTQPDSARNGLLTEGGQFHTAPMPVIELQGRLWRAVEDAAGGTHWGSRYNPLLISAPLDADLLRRESWSFTKITRQQPGWLDGKFGGWLEGNALVLPNGSIGNLLRVDYDTAGIAALTRLSSDGDVLEFDPARDFVNLPGAATKFTVRKDPIAGGGYWTLANAVPPPFEHARPRQTHIRNTLALLHSRDLRHWEQRRVLLAHPDVHRHGFQYVDWHFAGDDLLAVVRTSWEDVFGGAPNQHDANYLTFHRFRDFRNHGWER